jgi:hypothetical protein
MGMELKTKVRDEDDDSYQDDDYDDDGDASGYRKTYKHVWYVFGK